MNHHGRIKSFYSAYQKILEKVTSDYEKKKPLANSGILKDVYATRDIFRPKYDMRYFPQKFYKLMYKKIYEYMEFIEDLGDGYEIAEYSESELRKIYANKVNKFATNAITIPEKDFFDYCLEDKKIEHGYRYIAELSNKFTPEELKVQIAKLQNPDSDLTDDFSDIDMVSMLSANIKKENLFDLKLLYEQKFFKSINDKKIAKDYAQMLPDEFLKKYKLSQYNYDLYNLLAYLNGCLEKGEVNLQDGNFPAPSSRDLISDLKDNLQAISVKHNAMLQEQIGEIRGIDLDRFDKNYAEALKIRHFHHSGKDYMKYPKENGYQSFHMIVKTPDFVYEKQIRTAEQHSINEKGSASHDTFYKPAGIKKYFHRLKVPSPFSPKRDKNGEFITPTELGILPFDEAVQEFYNTSFAHFANMSFADFEKQFSSKEDFDQALLELSSNYNDDVMKGKITTCIKRFFKSFLRKSESKQKISNLTTTAQSSKPVMEEVPKDIATYPTESDLNPDATTSPNGLTPDGSDPHNNR